MPGTGFSRTDLFAGLALAVFTAAIYAQTLGFEFVDIDDPFHVTANPHVQRGLSPASVRWAWTAWHAGYWIPVTWMSHMVDVDLFGLSAGGHHATNVLLHLANTLLLFALLRGLTRASGASALAAALFALHPLRVESVAWVTERKDVLSGFFGLLSIAAYARYAGQRKVAFYFLAALAMAASLAAKPMLVTLPCVFLLLDYWPLERWNSRHELPRLCAEKLPFLALAAPFGVVTALAQRAATDAGDAALLGELDIPLPLRLANAVTAYARYLGKTVWPTDLSVVYPHPYRPGGVPLESGEIAAAAGLLLVISALVIWAGRRYLVVGWLWFLGTLVPVIGLVQSGEQGMADRFTYVPSMGLCIAVAWGAREIAALPQVRSARARAPLLSLALLVLAVLAAASYGQARHWQNSDTVYRKSLASIPLNPLMNTYYGNWLQSEGRLREAAEQHRAAAKVSAYAPFANANLGYLHTAMGAPERAIEHYREALRLEPRLGAVHLSLGRLLRVSGQPGPALVHFREAARWLPGESAPLVALVRTLATTTDPKLRDPDRAVRIAERAVELTGGREAESLDALAIAAAAAGRPERAVRVQRLAIEHAGSVAPAKLAHMRERLARYRAAAGELPAEPSPPTAVPVKR